jgi:hypothetical protein
LLRSLRINVAVKARAASSAIGQLENGATLLARSNGKISVLSIVRSTGSFPKKLVIARKVGAVNLELVCGLGRLGGDQAAHNELHSFEVISLYIASRQNSFP